MVTTFSPACPLPPLESECILLAHGGGGQLSAQLLERLILPLFHNPFLSPAHDGAYLPALVGPLAFSTDAHVVSPLFFPGGDLGTLALYGTINDLAMCGARARYLSLSLILEEGLPLLHLERILRHFAEAARALGVMVVTGDTKVVERGRAEGLYLSVSGIGEVFLSPPPLPQRIQPGDRVLLSGDLGRHGVALMLARADLGLDLPLESDCAPLLDPILALHQAQVEVHCLRDITRGGLVAILSELAEASNTQLRIHEQHLLISDEVQAACELLGLDPLSVACEGRFVAVVPEAAVSSALHALQQCSVSQQATVIGEVLPTSGVAGQPRLLLRTSLGTERRLERPLSDPLPRIC